MPIDPAQGFPTTTDESMAQRIADLNRRLDALERTTIVTVGTGAPGTSVTSRFYVDATGNFLYVRVGAAYKRTNALI